MKRPEQISMVLDKKTEKEYSYPQQHIYYNWIYTYFLKQFCCEKCPVYFPLSFSIYLKHVLVNFHIYHITCRDTTTKLPTWTLFPGASLSTPGAELGEEGTEDSVQLAWLPQGGDL